MTICQNCIYFQNIAKNGFNSDVWYNHLCKASPLPREINPTTGENVPVQFNSLGMKYVSPNDYEFCRNVNDGNCPKYQAEGDIPSVFLENK